MAKFQNFDSLPWYTFTSVLKRDHTDRIAVMFTSFILKQEEMGWLGKCYEENIPFMLSSYCQHWSLTLPDLIWRCFPGENMLIWQLKISYGKTLILSLPIPPACLDLHSSWKDWSQRISSHFSYLSDKFLAHLLILRSGSTLKTKGLSRKIPAWFITRGWHKLTRGKM